MKSDCRQPNVTHKIKENKNCGRNVTIGSHSNVDAVWEKSDHGGE